MSLSLNIKNSLNIIKLLFVISNFLFIYNITGGSVAAGLLIPLFLISLAVLLFMSARRYKWVQRFRQYQQNRYGNVLVTRDEDDDDDPPIV